VQEEKNAEVQEETALKEMVGKRYHPMRDELTITSVR